MEVAILDMNEIIAPTRIRPDTIWFELNQGMNGVWIPIRSDIRPELNSEPQLDCLVTLCPLLCATLTTTFYRDSNEVRGK
jgi:hypothetical protein